MLTRIRLTKKAARANHVAQVRRAKQIISDAAAELIARQLRDAADELRTGGVAKLSHVFRPRDWLRRLIGAVGPAIGRVMLLGAATELHLHGHRATKSAASDYLSTFGVDLEDEGIATEMPQSLLDSIEATLADSFQRPYWAAINGTTANAIQTVLYNGTTNGDSIRDMAWQLDQMSDAYGVSRGTTIARTESSRALNSGHLEGIQAIEDETGEVLNKQWVSVLGSTTRPTHREADGQTVASGEPFILGGYECQFPGDADLPPEESVNCLCTVISGGGVELDDEGDNLDGQ